MSTTFSRALTYFYAQTDSRRAAPARVANNSFAGILAVALPRARAGANLIISLSVASSGSQLSGIFILPRYYNYLITHEFARQEGLT